MSNVISANNKSGKYGFPWADGMLDIHKELFAYAIMRGNYGITWENKNLKPMGLTRADFKFEEPVAHLIRASKLMWPTDVEIQVRQYINRPLLRIWEELCNSDDVGCAGNASSGKTWGVAAWLNLDWMAAPHCTSSFVASTSLGGSEDRIWGSVAKLFKRSAFPIGHLIDHRKIIVFEDPSKDDERDYTNAIKALAFPQGDEGRRAVDTTRGRKNARVRAVVDELAEMDSYVNNIRINLRANDDMIYCGIANPAPGENPHKELCEPDDPRGYESISLESERWKTRTGTAIFLHGLRDCPNFEAPEDEPPPFPYLMTRRKLADILKDCYGDPNSLEYMRNAIGFWPLDNLDLSIISKAAIKNANISFEPTWSPVPKIRIAALDCGWTSGGDRNELTFGFVGQLRDGNRKKVAMYQGTKGYSIPVGAVFEDALAEKVVPDLIALGVEPRHFGLDISGDGGKVLSAFIKVWSRSNARAFDIVPISSMGAPSGRVVSSSDKRKCQDVFDRRLTEYWFSFYHGVSSRCLYGLDLLEHRELVAELTSRQYLSKSKKASAETKKEMKKRIGKSPDKADSAIYWFELCRKNGVDIIVDDNPQEIESKDIGDPSDIEVGTYAGSSFDEDGF